MKHRIKRIIGYILILSPLIATTAFLFVIVPVEMLIALGMLVVFVGLMLLGAYLIK